MDDHLGILQQRIQACAIGGQLALHDRERSGGKIQQKQEEDLDASDNDGSVREEALVGLVTKAENKSITRKQQRPEQQRTFLPGPEGRELIGRWEIAIAVVVNVGNRKIVLKGCGHKDSSGEKHSREAGDTGATCSFADWDRRRILP
jgi:hypothetical protein